MNSPELQQVIDALTELQQEHSVPKNIKLKLTAIAVALQSGLEQAMNVNKALHDLDEVVSDANLDTYTRTQIWNIASLLEKIQPKK